MSAMIRAAIAKSINHPSAAGKKPKGFSTAADRPTLVTARKIACSGCVAMLSITMLNLDFLFGRPDAGEGKTPANDTGPSIQALSSKPLLVRDARVRWRRLCYSLSTHRGTRRRLRDKLVRRRESSWCSRSRLAGPRDIHRCSQSTIRAAN